MRSGRELRALDRHLPVAKPVEVPRMTNSLIALASGIGHASPPITMEQCHRLEIAVQRPGRWRFALCDSAMRPVRCRRSLCVIEDE